MFSGQETEEEWNQMIAQCTVGMTEAEKNDFITKMRDMRTVMLEEQVDLQEQNIAYLHVDSDGVLGSMKNSRGMGAMKHRHRRASTSPLENFGSGEAVLSPDGMFSFSSAAQSDDQMNSLSDELEAYQEAAFQYTQLIDEYKKRIKYLEDRNKELTQLLEQSRQDVRQMPTMTSMDGNLDVSEMALQLQQMQLALSNAMSDLQYEREKSRALEAQFLKDAGVKCLDTEPEKSILKNKSSVPRGLQVTFDPTIVWMSSALTGDMELMIQFLNDGFDVNARNTDNLTALHNACCDNDNVDLVLFLIDQGADVNCIDKDGWSPLHGAACCGHYDICRALLQNGASMNVQNNDNETPYELCVENSEEPNAVMELFTEYHQMFHAVDTVYATFEFTAEKPDELDLNPGDVLEIILDKKESEHWWWARKLNTDVEVGEDNKENDNQTDSIINTSDNNDNKFEGYVPSIMCTLYPLYGFAIDMDEEQENAPEVNPAESPVEQEHTLEGNPAESPVEQEHAPEKMPERNSVEIPEMVDSKDLEVGS